MSKLFILQGAPQDTHIVERVERVERRKPRADTHMRHSHHHSQHHSHVPAAAAALQPRRAKDDAERHHRVAAFPPVRMGSWRRFRSASQELADMILTPAPSSVRARKPAMSVRRDC